MLLINEGYSFSFLFITQINLKKCLVGHFKWENILMMLRFSARSRMNWKDDTGRQADRPAFTFLLCSYWLDDPKRETNPLLPRAERNQWWRRWGDRRSWSHTRRAHSRCPQMLLFCLLPYVRLLNDSSLRSSPQFSCLTALKPLPLSWKVDLYCYWPTAQMFSLIKKILLLNCLDRAYIIHTLMLGHLHSFLWRLTHP